MHMGADTDNSSSCRHGKKISGLERGLQMLYTSRASKNRQQGGGEKGYYKC